ncbi:hypothetical protein BD309DRAFT_958741 [Dichomitus squalens]|uniref:Uncharacterized protein n=1 Tax=Dichomitus squalens TaxID=114155 RepID=A0A4Q9NU48_9APHY|nr:hypothetical protein BD309DRAFT_958741 [Dichomitus squalens]TBU59184.1 hypothetical protein BD310DRAFT_423705 [Dichomitus squalens]
MAFQPCPCIGDWTGLAFLTTAADNVPLSLFEFPAELALIFHHLPMPMMCLDSGQMPSTALRPLIRTGPQAQHTLSVMPGLTWGTRASVNTVHSAVECTDRLDQMPTLPVQSLIALCLVAGQQQDLESLIISIVWSWGNLRSITTGSLFVRESSRRHLEQFGNEMHIASP